MIQIPKISVITPIYKTDHDQLKQAIESILNQTLADFEFLILNDSPDQTDLDDLVKSYADPRIKYFKNDQNHGISYSRNKLISLAKGEYIAFFDHDDLSLPQRLELEANYLDQHPDIGVLGAQALRIDLGNNHTTNHPQENEEIKFALMHSMVLLSSTMMVRKSILERTNIKFDEQYTVAEDYLFCIKLIQHTKFHNLPNVLVHYRVHEQNISHKASQTMNDLTILARNEAMKNYPYIFHEACSTKFFINLDYWIYLFNIPFIKVKHHKEIIRYKLFGLIPIIKIKRIKFS